MMTILKLLIFCILFEAVQLISTEKNPVSSKYYLLLDKPNCNNKRLIQIDGFITKLMTFGKNGRKFPTTEHETEMYCSQTLKLSTETEKFFKECFPLELSNIVKVFLFSVKRSARQICSKRKRNKKYQNFFQYGRCVNIMAQNDTCLDTNIRQVRALVPLKIGKQKINFICCYYIDMLQCIRTNLRKLPCHTEESEDLMLNFIREVSGDSINLSCGEYNENTDACEHIGEPDLSKTDKNFPISDKKLNSYTIAALEVFDSLK